MSAYGNLQNDKSQRAAIQTLLSAAGSADKDISGSSNVTLAESEGMVTLLRLTGATQTITVTIPLGSVMTVLNETSYTQNIKRFGSNVSISIPAGAAVQIS